MENLNENVGSASSEFFLPIEFSAIEKNCISAIQNIEVYGIKDAIKLLTIINTTLNGTFFQSRIILYNQAKAESSIFDFKGGREITKELWDGKIHMAVDWNKLGNNYINVTSQYARLEFSQKCYKESAILPETEDTITRKIIFQTAPSIPMPKNNDEPVPLAMLNELTNQQGFSKNLTTEYLYIKGKLGYLTGHDFSSDVFLDIDPPKESGIKSKASKICVFKEETNKYFIAGTSLFPYLHTNSDNPQKIIFKCKVFNSHEAQAVTLQIQFRTKKSGSWYTPTGEKKTINPKSFEEYQIEFDRGSNSWLDFKEIFDLYINSSTEALVNNPAWLYIGDADMYYINATGKNMRPTLHAGLIDKGIEKEQLSNELIAEIENKKPTEKIIPTKKNIVFSGSSITWGDGRFLGSFVGLNAKFVHEQLSSLIPSDKMSYSHSPSIFLNEMLYENTSRRVSGIGRKVSFRLFGDEVAICQVKERTSNYGIMTVKADGVVIGTFDNQNTIRSEEETFTGTNIAKVQLKHPATFNHEIKINGILLNKSDIAFNTGGYGGSVPADKKAFVYRSLNADGEPVHEIGFNRKTKEAIVEVEVRYNYGRIVCYERSTRGQLNDDEKTNESPYGSGTTAFDPANPTGGLSSGLEFRAIDKNAFFIHKFIEAKERYFEIEITGGQNPYLNINFATNRFHNLMNAGIGGWTVGALTNNDKINDFPQFYKWFMPDMIFLESATNDDWAQSNRKISRAIGEKTKDEIVKLDSLDVSKITYNPQTDKYAVEMATGTIESITPFGLTCKNIIGSNVQPGDIVRIGNYYGDNKQVACREIESVNLSTGIISWLQPLNAEEMLNIETLSDLINTECCIRSLADYQSKYESLIEKVRKISPHCAIRVVQPGLSNYFTRQLWGYDMVHRRLCAKYPNVQTVEITDWLYDFQNNSISGNSKQKITATGASSYLLSKTGHWQGFKVLVNGVDVYGKDCYIESGLKYRPDQSKSGSALNKTNVYNNYGVAVSEPMRLVFTKNIPASGSSIEILNADNVWSGDFCHPNNIGNYIYSQKYCDEIK